MYMYIYIYIYIYIYKTVIYVGVRQYANMPTTVSFQNVMLVFAA